MLQILKKQKQRSIGIAFAMTDVLAMTVVYIISKIALNDIPYPVFGIFWFTFGIIWNLVFIATKPSMVGPDNFRKAAIRTLVIVGILDAIATLMWFYAIDTSGNPALVSFMTNVGPVYASLLGYFFLKERFNWGEIAGIILTLIGAVLITYRENISPQNVFLSGAGIILISSLVNAIQKVVLKQKIRWFHPSVLSINRAVFLLLYSVVMVTSERLSLNLSWESIILIAAGSLFGPFISANSGYSALKRLKVTTYAVISTSRSFFVTIAGILFLSVSPDSWQFIGGSLTVTGVISLTMAKAR